MTRAVILIPSALACRQHSPYRRAIEAALIAQFKSSSGANTLTWQWREPVYQTTCASAYDDRPGCNGGPGGFANGMKMGSLQAQAQALLKSDPGLDFVLIPGLEAPYQARYLTRVFRTGMDDSRTDGKGKKMKRAAPSASAGVSSIIHVTTLRLAPAERTYATAAALCRHFGWSNVVLLSSDDDRMQSAQGLRQQLTAAGIHIRRHQIFSPSHTYQGAASSASSSSILSHDLDAIRTSGTRIVFLLSSCRATHQVLSAARQKKMLRDYAWVVLHPNSACALDDAPSGFHDADVSEEGELALLEMYQGVLGLVWDGATAANGAAWASTGKTSNSSDISSPAAGALSDFCRGSDSHAYDASGPLSEREPAGAPADVLDLSPRFLFETMRHLASLSSTPSANPSPASSSHPVGEVMRDTVGGSDMDGDVVLHPDLAVSVLSFSGARRASLEASGVEAASNDTHGVGDSASRGKRRRRSNSTASKDPVRIEVIHQPIARLALSPHGIDPSSSAPADPLDSLGRLELLTARPLRWPGDVRAQPRDLVEGWGTQGEGPDFLFSPTAGRDMQGLVHGLGLWSVIFGMAAMCIALTPLWNWVYKRLFKRKELSPPCLDGGCAPIPAISEVKDAASQEEDRAFIATRMAELTEKQAELLRSVEVDMKDVVMKRRGGGIGQGSFSIVYKGYYQNSHVAIKVLRRVDERNFRRFLEEIMLHKDLRHPNVVMFRGASWRDGRLLMLIDYAGRGTLADVLRRSKGTLRWKPVKLNMALGIAKGMAFLHQTRYYDMWTSSYQRCVVHRDLKPQNILVTDSYHVQITDFGEARTVDHENTMTQVGTQLFVAPEVVRGERYSEKCDVYSFAVVLLAMLELRPDVLDVFAESLPEVERSETGITKERLKEPEGVEVTDACKTCPLNKANQPPPGVSLAQAQAAASTPEHECPLAQHKEFKGVVAHAVTRAIVYDDFRPPIKGCPYQGLKTLIEKCWIPDVNDRPGFAAVVEALDGRVRREVSDYVRPNGGSTSGHSTGSTSCFTSGSIDHMMVRDGSRQGFRVASGDVARLRAPHGTNT